VSGSGVSKSLLPPIETIIEESLKIKLKESLLDKLRDQYKETNAPMKEEKKMKKLLKVKTNILKPNV
jgi:predicted transcriptional regulator